MNVIVDVIHASEIFVSSRFERNSTPLPVVKMGFLTVGDF